MTDEEFAKIEARVKALTDERDRATADAENQTAGMREVALFRAANAQGCLGGLTAYLLEELRKARETPQPPQEGWTRIVTPRCPNISRHRPLTDLSSCACHPIIPMPCPECFAVETVSRQVPWSELGWERQPGATG